MTGLVIVIKSEENALIGTVMLGHQLKVAVTFQHFYKPDA